MTFNLGCGYATVVMSFLFSSYFSTILVYCMFYAYNSIKNGSAPLPWQYCNNSTGDRYSWASSECYDENSNSSSSNGSPVTQDYFDNVLLRKTSGIEELGMINVDLLIMLIITWIIIYIFVFRGIKTIGKVVYFTALMPYLMLIALLIRGLSLPGAMTGVEYFLGLNGYGDWSKLKDVNVWINATAQIFNSIGIGFGALITFSSFNKRSGTLLQDTLFISLVNR